MTRGRRQRTSTIRNPSSPMPDLGRRCQVDALATAARNVDMTHNQATIAASRGQAVSAEFQGMIRARYPEVDVAVTEGHGDDPVGVYLLATVDVEDTDEVFDVVVDRLVELQVEHGVPVYVLPLRPLNRIAKLQKAGRITTRGSVAGVSM